jgi:8-oxo-dGTP pyrophosphatase MutT (NUDIX family)
MPGGFIDQDESAEEALRREVREEIGARVVRATFLITVPNQYLYKGFIIPVLDLYYHCLVEGLDQLHFGDGEVEDCFFAAIDEEMLSDFAFAANRSALRYFRDTLQEQLPRRT